jgi:hypothetical protein
MEIPVLLRVASAKAAFIDWLSTMPVPPSAKRKLAQLWSANTGGTLEAFDYAIIMAKPTLGKVS